MDTGMTLEEAQKLVDEELLVQEQRVLELKMRHNSYARACLLPPELLLEIFMYLMVPFKIKKWHGVTHVCRQWRCVALEARNLWTSPPPRNREYIACMLERSQTAGINIRMDVSTFNPIATAIFKHASRIKTLKLVQDSRELTRTMTNLLASGQVLSRLEVFSLENTRPHNNYDRKFVLSVEPFRQSTFLRHIDITGISINWDMFPFPNLTHLRLDRCGSTSNISQPELCHLLKRMPLLEYLSLNAVVVSKAANQATFVQLPHLKGLSLQIGPPGIIRSLLNELSLPKLRRLDILAGIWDQPDSHSAESTAAAISTTLKNGDFEMLDAMSISGSMALTLYSNHIDLPRHKLQAALDLSHTVERTAQYLTALNSGAFCNCAALTRVHIMVELHRDDLCQILDALPQLEALKLSHGNTIKALPSALNMVVNNALPGSKATLPRLRSITCCLFYWCDDGLPVLTELCNTLYQRHENGVGIKKLCLLKCQGFPDSARMALDAIGILIYASEKVSDLAWMGDT